MERENFETICNDGVRLKGELFKPENPKAIIQFNCGTGAKREIYYAFLTYLAENDFLCCLWDYRGSGESDPVNLRNCDFTFSDYGVKDMPAIKLYLTKRFPDLPFIIVGHSAGGQQVGFMDNLEGVKGIINFAVSSGYYSNMPIGYRLKAYFFFYLFAPISNLLNGYIKGTSLKLMEDLPRNVVFEWRAWLTKEDYFFHKQFYGVTVPLGQYKKFNFPIHTYWTVDDTISNEANTEAFWRNISSSEPITFTRLNPAELELKKIDHFGFFKKVMKEKLWIDVVKRLDILAS